jgi:hypothetical protein
VTTLAVVLIVLPACYLALTRNVRTPEPAGESADVDPEVL